LEWIVTADVERETWRRLLEFANIEFAEIQIARRHGQPTDRRVQTNYRKQAEQMRVALLQAREYFEAAYRTSLITSPNHVYYGMISLASAVMLLLGDGSKSYDMLRRSPLNNHHGLGFSVDLPASRAAQGTNLLDNSRVEILDRGHFKSWYNTLPATTPAVATVRTRASDGTSTTGVRAIGSESRRPFVELIGHKSRVIECLRLLPEISADLERFGVPVIRSSTTHEVEMHPDGRHTHKWRLRNAHSNERLCAILDQFRFASDLVDRVTVVPDIELSTTTGCIVSCALRQEDRPQFSWPSGRMDLNGEFVTYAESPGVPEFADWYFSAYGLSMLSRYFPDLWIACLDAHCRSAKLVEAFVECARLKVPVLALEFLLGSPIRVSTHRAPWYS